MKKVDHRKGCYGGNKRMKTKATQWTSVGAFAASILCISAVTAPVKAGFIEDIGFGTTATSASLVGQNRGGYTKRLTGIAQYLASQLKLNQKESRGADSTVVVASIVNLEDPNEASRIGLALSNSLTHALQMRGYRAIDFHLRKVMKVTQGGDFVTSNSVTELRNNFDITYMVAGTLSEHSDGLIITLRMVDWETGVVVSSAEAHLTTAEYFGLMSDMEISRPVVKVVRRNVPQPVQQVMKLRRPTQVRERRK